MAHLFNSAFTLSSSAISGLAQQDGVNRIPLWIWIVVIFLVILVGIIWTLREEETLKQEVAQVASRPDTLPEPVAAPVEPKEPVAERTRTAPPAPQPDDLKKINGIGPKISQQLNERGIFTFEQLANTEVSFLEQMMDELDWHINEPDSWPKQARQLADEKQAKDS